MRWTRCWGRERATMDPVELPACRCVCVCERERVREIERVGHFVLVFVSRYKRAWLRLPPSLFFSLAQLQYSCHFPILYSLHLKSICLLSVSRTPPSSSPTHSFLLLSLSHPSYHLLVHALLHHLILYFSFLSLSVCRALSWVSGTA